MSSILYNTKLYVRNKFVLVENMSTILNNGLIQQKIKSDGEKYIKIYLQNLQQQKCIAQAPEASEPAEDADAAGRRPLPRVQHGGVHPPPHTREERQPQ